MHPKRYFLWMHTKNRRKNTVLPKNFSRQYCLWHLCQYQHTKPICSYWQGTIFSSWNHQWLWLVTHSGLAPSSLGPLRGVSLSQNSRNHGITTIPILHGCYRSRHLTSGGRSKMKTLPIPSIHPYRSWRICGTAQCVTVPHVWWNHHIQLYVSTNSVDTSKL